MDEAHEAREKARRDAEDWRCALERPERRVQDSFTHGLAEGRQAGLLSRFL